MHDPRFISCGRYLRPSTRRQFLARAGAGLGLVALGDILLAQSSPPGDESAPAGILALLKEQFEAE